MSENLHEDGDCKSLLARMAAMIAGIASDVAEIKAVQARHGSRLAAIEARLDAGDQDHNGCLRP